MGSLWSANEVRALVAIWEDSRRVDGNHARIIFGKDMNMDTAEIRNKEKPFPIILSLNCMRLQEQDMHINFI